MESIPNDALIDAARAVLHPHTVGGYGPVCAEHAAIAAMVTAREYEVAKIVAVYRDEDGVLFVLPPCGRCRLFISQIDPANLSTRVVLSRTSSPELRELLPCTDWPEPLG